MARQLDKAARFSEERGGVYLFCGEFGAYEASAFQADRVRYYQTVSTMLDNRNIPRTSWGYFGGFGIFNTNRGGEFNSDLNVEIVSAMGFTPQPQIPGTVIREAFTVFRRFPSKFSDITHWDCDMDLFVPHGDRNTIGFSNPQQYGLFCFSFRRNIDWQYLHDQNYFVSFRARANAQARFTVQFWNHEYMGNIPWRNIFDITVPGDGAWHEFRVPLQSMREEGAWVQFTQEWREPEGLFRWEDVERLVFMSINAQPGVSIYFDNIKLTY
jgi:endoglucanase